MSKNIFLMDIPDGEDKFQIHSNIARLLKEKIVKLTLDKNSFNIGLFGDWGVGKSFIINKLEQLLANNDDIIMLKFDAWKYDGTPLERSILFELEKQAFTGDNPYYFNGKSLRQILDCKIVIDSEIKADLQGIKTQFTKLSKPIFYTTGVITLFQLLYTPIIEPFIRNFFNSPSYINNNLIFLVETLLDSFTIIITPVFLATILIKIFQPKLSDLIKKIVFRREDVKEETLATFSSDQFESIFSDMISNLSYGYDNKAKKLVIVFDNIDRCEPHFAYKIISTIKTYMDLNNCIYLIPCDDEALKVYLKNSNYSNSNRNYEQEFLDKFFQATLRIPTLDSNNTDKFIEESLKSMNIPGLIPDDTSIIREVLYYAYKGQTPRQIKRFLNDFSMYYSLAYSIDSNCEFLLKNKPLFTVIIAIKQRWPKFEMILINQPNFRSKFYSAIDSEDSASVDNITHFIESSCDDPCELISFLKYVRHWFNNKEPLLSLIYLIKYDNEIDIQNNFRLGKEVPNSTTSYNIAKKLLSEFSNEKTYTYMSQLLESIFIIIKKSSGTRTEEFKWLFEKIFLSLDIHKEQKLILNFLNKHILLDLQCLDSINFNESNSIELLRNYIFIYFSSPEYTYNKIDLFEFIFLNHPFWSLDIAKKYFEHIIDNDSLEDFYDTLKKDIKTFNCIDESYAIKVLSSTINSFSDKLLDLLLNYIKLNSVIKMYFDATLIGYDFNNLPYQYLNEKSIILENFFKIIKQATLDDYCIKLVTSFINAYDKNRNSNHSLLFKFFVLIHKYLETEKQNESFYKFKDNLSDKEIIGTFIGCYGDIYFMDNIFEYYIADPDNYDLSISIFLLKELCDTTITLYIEKLLILGIYSDELDLICDKLSNSQLGTVKYILTDKILEHLTWFNTSITNGKDCKKDIADFISCFENEKLIATLDFSKFNGYSKLLSNIYFEYPQYFYHLITILFEKNILIKDDLNAFLIKILEMLERDVDISQFISISNIFSVTDIKGDTKIFENTSSILNHLLNLGHTSSYYDFAYELLKIYVSTNDILTFKPKIKTLFTNGFPQFNEFLLADEEVATELESNDD